MARTKKAKKMIKVHETKRKRNVQIKSEIKTRVKSAATAAPENMKDLVKIASKRADQAASKGVIHKNRAARIKSRLMKKMRKTAAVSN